MQAEGAFSPNSTQSATLSGIDCLEVIHIIFINELAVLYDNTLK